MCDHYRVKCTSLLLLSLSGIDNTYRYVKSVLTTYSYFRFTLATTYALWLYARLAVQPRSYSTVPWSLLTFSLLAVLVHVVVRSRVTTHLVHQSSLERTPTNSTEVRFQPPRTQQKRKAWMP